ncbi:hypothetical protein SGFS_026170 [Streptomyces graminofaciens]|uniref:Cupin domain-containing protein n=1 Tax=Streptomyces graminofaciens TaxID=68212 RepID=A0ABM7F647_9ACTN|nr:hypothetical protein SGFS_026170 [Streptomyces graminofaciens]
MTSQPSSHDGFHPDLTDRPSGPLPEARTRVHHIRADDLDGGTAQTDGMRRFAAISGARVGSERMWMWMGQTTVAPATASADHHHGDSETAIYIVSGHPEFVFLADPAEGSTRPMDDLSAAGAGCAVHTR